MIFHVMSYLQGSSVYPCVEVGVLGSVYLHIEAGVIGSIYLYNRVQYNRGGVIESY